MRLAFISILSLFFLQAPLSLQAQANRYGIPLITNYPFHETGGSEQNMCITQDHRGVLYLGNYDMGILEYDGVHWRNIVSSGYVPVTSLVTGEDGVVYVGAEDDFGLLEPDQKGELHYRSLCDSSLRQIDRRIIVWKSYAHERRIWFCTQQGIYVFNPRTEDIEFIQTPMNAYRSYMVDGRLYNSDLAKGLMVLKDGSFEMVSGGAFFHEMAITGLEQFDSESLLVSTREHGIYLLDRETGQLDEFFLSRQLMEEFRQNQITSIKLLNENVLVCTHSNGLYVLDQKGILKEIISESEGLIDNNIIQVYTEQRPGASGPLWIAHRKGISKVEINNPFRVFTVGSGVEGLITDIVNFNGRLFVSSMSGLFYQSASSKGTIFRKIAGIPGEVNDLHIFQPRRGRTMLLASSLSGLYVIDRNMRVSSIRQNLLDFQGNTEDLEQIAGRFTLNDPELSNVIYTGCTQVLGLQYSRGRWREIFRSDQLKGEIHRMARDRYGYLWISNPNEVIRIDMELSPAITMKEFNSRDGLPLGEGNRIFLNPVSRNLMAGTRNGIYRFNYFQEKFVPDSLFNSLLPKGPNRIRTLHGDRDGDFWLSFENKDMGWIEMVLRNQGDRLEVLIDKPFRRLPKTASAELFFDDPESGVWFSKSDEIYHFDKTFGGRDSLPYQTLIRKVSIHSDSVLFMGANFKLKANGQYAIQPSQDHDTRPFIKYRYNTIGFHWAAPYFEQEERLQYSFYLEGFSKSWSEWQSVSTWEFSKLKFGRYALRVKARNIYGFESDEAHFAFVITRPWYATYLAYLGYILLSSLLIYLFVRVCTGRQRMNSS